MKKIIPEKIEQEVLKEIKSGIYRNCYLIYNRKSTDEPENQKNSIQYQKSENSRFASRERLPIASFSLKGFCLDGIISEKHSGFKEDTELVFGKGGTVQYRIDRPIFYTLVEFLNTGYFKGVIFLCWDRASRNKGDNTIIEKLMKQGIDFRFALATYDKTSSGALHRDVDGMFAQHHSRVTSEKVSLNIKNQRSKGFCTSKAPVGYLNLGTIENKPFDPVRSPIIKLLFEKYAAGDWSLADLARWANSQGFTMPPTRRRRTAEELLIEEVDDSHAEIEPICRPLRANNVYSILRNPFYTGRVKGNSGELIMSNSHSALVTDEIFESVQRLLHKKNVSIHYTKKLASPYRGLIRCSNCTRVYTPYSQKGIMYYGCRCRNNCSNKSKSFNISFLEAEVGSLLKMLSFTNRELAELNERTRDDGGQGSDTISYTVTNGFGSATATQVISVISLPSAGTIIGASSVCVGSTLPLLDAALGGTWTESTGNASLSGSIVFGVTEGVDAITYAVTNTCGTAYATKAITVNPLPDAGTIVGNSNVCEGLTIALSDTALGGNWSVSNPEASVTSTGLVLGITAGSDLISYAVTNSCGTAYTTFPITIYSSDACSAAGIHGVANSDDLIKIYPNPTDGSFTVEMPGEKGRVVISIFDVYGRGIESRTIDAISGLKETFNLEKLARGTYLVRVKTDDATHEDKIVIW